MSKKKLKYLSLIVLLSTLILVFPINTKIELTKGALPSDGMKILYLLSDGFTKSWGIDQEKPAFEALGFTVETAGETATIEDIDSDPFDVDLLFTEVDIADYVAIHIPGGTVDNELTTHPFALTTNQDAMEIVKDAYDGDKIMIASHDGPVVYAEADIISGKNITCRDQVVPTILAAGANLIPEALPAVDDPFITFTYAIANRDYLMDLLKLLGIHETNPPVIDDLTVDILTATAPGSVNVTVEVSDVWETELVTLRIFKYNPTTSLYELDTTTQMLDIDDKTIFNTIKSNLAAGNYSIGIQTEDILNNIGIYDGQFSFVIGSTETFGSPLVTTLTIIGFSIIAIVIFRRKRPKKYN
jgi:protease I